MAPGEFFWRGRRRRSVPGILPPINGAGWIVVDFKPGETHNGGRVAYGPWSSAERRDRAVEAWRRDKLVASVEVATGKPQDVLRVIAVVQR